MMKKTVTKKSNKVVTQDNIRKVLKTTKRAVKNGLIGKLDDVVIYKPSQPKEYKLTMSFNDQVFSVETNDLYQAISELVPFQLKTRVILLIQKRELSCEKMLLLLEARRIFRNKVALEVFINRLIFK